MPDVATNPSWTDESGHDPGITLLQVLAFSTAALGAGLFWKWRAQRNCDAGRQAA